MTFEVKPVKPVMGKYPACDICFGNLGRRIFTIAHIPNGEEDPKGYIACGACYTLWFRIQQMAGKGLLSIEDIVEDDEGGPQ